MTLDEAKIDAIAREGKLLLSSETLAVLRETVPSGTEADVPAWIALTGIRLMQTPGMAFGTLVTPSGVVVTLDWLLGHL